MTIDIQFDMYSDTPTGKDPDKFSPTLRNYHRQLWSKPLPSGTNFTLVDDEPGSYLFHQSVLGEFHLNSDALGNTFRSASRMSPITSLVPAAAMDKFFALCCTIGAYVIFPGKMIDNKQTINMARGCHPKIRDRIDLNAVLPKYAENEGVPPLLAVGMDDLKHKSRWLEERIKEIERALHELPSIAILVNSEDDVLPVAESLSDALSDLNIRVVPCPNGQVRGNESEVRVFSVEHIKGLEFEAVFFVGLDRLAEQHPDLFDKFLYVGATRAATYLGLTCETELPETMLGLSNLFGDNWA